MFQKPVRNITCPGTSLVNFIPRKLTPKGLNVRTADKPVLVSVT
jgi:hypothetical protein